MSCSLDGLFPASEARVYLALGDERLNPDIVLEGDALRATATATASAEQEGARQLVCSVSLGGESRDAWENVTVYSKRGRSQASLAQGWSQRNAKEGQRVRGGLNIGMGGAPGRPTEEPERQGGRGCGWTASRGGLRRGGAVAVGGAGHGIHQ